MSKQIESQFAAFTEAQRVKESAFKERMQNLEDTIANINDRLDAIAKKLCTQVLKHLTAQDGPLAQQASKVDSLQTSVENLSVMLQKLVSATPSTTEVHSPPRKKPATASPPPPDDDIQME